MSALSGSTSHPGGALEREHTTLSGRLHGRDGARSRWRPQPIACDDKGRREHIDRLLEEMIFPARAKVSSQEPSWTQAPSSLGSTAPACDIAPDARARASTVARTLPTELMRSALVGAPSQDPLASETLD